MSRLTELRARAGHAWRDIAIDALVVLGCWGILIFATGLLVGTSRMPLAEAAIVAGGGVLYVALGSLRRPVDVAHTIGLCALTALLWWAIYGRLTPFPKTAEFVNGGPQPITSPYISVQWIAAYVATFALVTASAIHNDAKALAREAAAWTWFGLTVWAIDRGDYDGLWVLGVPPAAILAVTMLYLSRQFARVRTSRSRG